MQVVLVIQLSHKMRSNYRCLSFVTKIPIYRVMQATVSYM